MSEPHESHQEAGEERDPLAEADDLSPKDSGQLAHRVAERRSPQGEAEDLTPKDSEQVAHRVAERRSQQCEADDLSPKGSGQVAHRVAERRSQQCEAEDLSPKDSGQAARRIPERRSPQGEAEDLTPKDSGQVARRVLELRAQHCEADDLTPKDSGQVAHRVPERRSQQGEAEDLTPKDSGQVAHRVAERRSQHGEAEDLTPKDSGQVAHRVPERRSQQGEAEDLTPNRWGQAARRILERRSQHETWTGAEVFLHAHARWALELDARSGGSASSHGQGLSAIVRVWRDSRVGVASAPVSAAEDLEALLDEAAHRASTGAPATFPSVPTRASDALPTWRPQLSPSRARALAERIAREVVPAGVVVQALVVTQRSSGSVLVRSDGFETGWTQDSEDAFLRCETSRGAVVDAVASPRASSDEPVDLASLRARLAEAVEALEGPAEAPDLSLPLVLRPSVAAPLVAGLAGLLRGDVVVTIPALLRAQGRKLFPSLLCVEDDPLHPLGTRRRQVDDEGCEARALRLVDEGRLMGFLHSEETAALLGAAPSGRGFRDGASPASPLPLNLCIMPRRDALPAHYTELVARVETFTTMARPGTISLIAGGWEVRDGRRVRRVTPLELDLPLLETFRSLRGVGPDLTFFPSAEGCGTPTLVLPPPKG